MNKFEGFIVDLDGMYLVNINDSTLVKFDFTDMVVIKITKQSRAKYPIKYCYKKQTILIWQQRGWQDMGNDEAIKAIKYMFDCSVDQQILGSNND